MGLWNEWDFGGGISPPLSRPVENTNPQAIRKSAYETIYQIILNTNSGGSLVQRITDILADCRDLTSLRLIIFSPVSLTFQLVGNDQQNSGSVVDIGTPDSASAGKKEAWVITEDEWMPYIGIKYTLAATTEGVIFAQIIGRRLYA